jgi:transposase
VVACRRVIVGAQVVGEVRSFPTTTRGLLVLADWLHEVGCTQVAMESTGVYWKPVWHVLEEEFELVLANAAHIKNVPGRKSDVNDATWIADLLAHGLIRSSFVPPGPIQELRDLTRTRKQLVREVVQHKQRIQKVLEDANVKLDSVVSDVLGASGRRMLRAMIGGEQNPHKLAALADERLAASQETLAEALHGRVTQHHRFLLQQHLDMVAHLEKAVGEFEARTLSRRHRTTRHDNDHAGNRRANSDMKRFPTVGHLISWAGLCPGLNQSAGKVKSRTLRNGAPWLKTVPVQSAWVASRNKDGYLRSQFLRIKARRGPKKAIMAVAASILTAAYHLVRDAVPYKELGPVYLLRLDHERAAARLTQRLRNLGYEVEIKKAAA